MKRIRLQKHLAQAGIGSRRHCEEIILAGRVTVDGKVAELGSTVDPAGQTVEVDGRRTVLEPTEYWLLNKPRGVVSTAFDPQGRPTVVDAVPTGGRVFPVGRLDLDTTGLILVTNDGGLAAGLLHPRYHVEKEYLVKVRGRVSQRDLARLRIGIDLEDGPTAPAQVEIISPAPGGGDAATTTLSLVIYEGRTRQVRRMMEALGHRVVALHRRRIDGITDAGLPIGSVRSLSPDEVDRLRESSVRG